jgi:hypothetical protein
VPSIINTRIVKGDDLIRRALSIRLRADLGTSQLAKVADFRDSVSSFEPIFQAASGFTAALLLIQADCYSDF